MRWNAFIGNQNANFGDDEHEKENISLGCANEHVGQNAIGAKYMFCKTFQIFWLRMNLSRNGWINLNYEICILCVTFRSRPVRSDPAFTRLRVKGYLRSGKPSRPSSRKPRLSQTIRRLSASMLSWRDPAQWDRQFVCTRHNSRTLDARMLLFLVAIIPL